MPAVNIWLLLFENDFRSYHYTGALKWRKSIVVVVTQDRVIADNLKKQIKNQTLYTCRLFLLTLIFNILAIGQKYLNILEFTDPLSPIYIE